METLNKVYNDHPKTLIFASAAAIRILLAVAWPSLPDLLTGRVELSTPVSSFKRCMLYLQQSLLAHEAERCQELSVADSTGRLVSLRAWAGPVRWRCLSSGWQGSSQRGRNGAKHT